MRYWFREERNDDSRQSSFEDNIVLKMIITIKLNMKALVFTSSGQAYENLLFHTAR